MSIKDALDIARQAAEGLEAAHEKGIVHRDIKPANIMVDPKGRPTIMDFGLARLTEASRLTKVDTAMGTVAYMSPEQAQGMDVDSRTDICALGCVLYEMVSGQRPFQGQYDQALLYEIVHEEVAPLTSLRAGVPMELEFIVGKCLAKDHDDRHGSAGEVARDLRTLAEKLKSGRSTILRTGQMTSAVPATMAGVRTVNPTAALPAGAVIVQQKRLRMLQGLAAACVVALLGLSAFNLTEAPPETSETPTRRFSFSQEGLSFASISPDGRYLAFKAGTGTESSLWLRAIGTETAREIPGTEGARPRLGWSPDSQAIVFATRTEIKRVGIDGGDPVTLGDLPGTGSLGFMGGSWSPDGERIVFSSTAGVLWEIPARGGEPRVLMEQVSGRNAVEPHFLPADTGPEALICEAGSQIWVLNLETGERSEVGPGSAPVYSEDGYLIYGSGEAGEPGLYALPFSLASLEPTGEAFPIAEDGQSASLARDGTLVFLDGNIANALGTLVWRNRAGELLETIGQPQPGLRYPALSPDGQRIAVVADESGNSDIWIHDLVRSTKTRLTFDEGNERFPSWSPSGEEIAYQQNPLAGEWSIRSKAADGTGEAAVLVESEVPLWTPAWSRDGRHLVYYEINPETQRDIRYLEFGTDGGVSEPVTFLSTPANERAPRLSPDGRFLAYMSDESGRLEIYVRPFPDGDGKWQVSVEGGSRPRWSRDGRELYYVWNGVLWSVSVSTGQGVVLGQPQRLFQSDELRASNVTPPYDISADGQRFVMIAPVEDNAAEETPPTIRIVQNWHEEFRDREQ